MSTICSAIRRAVRVGVRTVGTSTNCSADCGSGIGEREGHGEQEIVGTSITCSAIGKSRIRARCLCRSQPSAAQEDRESARTGRRSRDPPRRAAPSPHVAPAAHPDRVAGNRPRGGASGTPPCGTTRTSPPALSFLCPREEWCLYSDRAICTDSFSWRAHCRSRRSLLRRAAPSPAGSRSLTATARDTDKRNEAHTLVFWLALCCVALVVVVVQMIKATACLSMRVPTCSKFKGNTELQLADSVRDLSLQRQIPGV